MLKHLGKTSSHSSYIFLSGKGPSSVVRGSKFDSGLFCVFEQESLFYADPIHSVVEMSGAKLHRPLCFPLE